MYNRYIPQPDGSFRCRPAEAEREPCAASCPEQPAGPPDCPGACGPMTPGEFFRKLLPEGLDLGDLMILLLLLIMAGDSREDPNTALLTLVLYLFL